MKPVATIFSFFIFCSVHAQFTQEDFKPLLALQGVWQMKIKNGFLLEQWTRANDSLMTSKSYRVNNNDTVVMETVQLTFSNGTITYTPTVPDQNEGKPVTFTLVAINDAGYIFENKQHDYPQQIIYSLKGADLKVITRALSDAPDKERHFNFSAR